MSDVTPIAVSAAAQRGPRYHEMRERIVAAAEKRFRVHGYHKTTVAEVAADLGFSPAYIYKFFPSKLAICEGVCGGVLDRIDRELWAVATEKAPASDRLRKVYVTLLEQSIALFFHDRKLHDMVREGIHNHWDSVERHKAAMEGVARHLVREGQMSGEFCREQDEEQMVLALMSAMIPFAHPAVLESSINTNLPERCRLVADFLVRAVSARAGGDRQDEKPGDGL